MMRRLVLPVLLGVASLLAGACDSGPSGPGEYTAVVELESGAPTSLGAALVEVEGTGIQGFTGAGSTRAFSAPQSTEGVFRVVLVNEAGGGDLRFRVSVEDLEAGEPTAKIVSLADPENRPIPLAGSYRVRFSR